MSEGDEMGEVILRDGDVVRLLTLWASRSGWGVDARSFELGRMSVMCALESQSRIFEAFEGTTLTSFNREGIASALRDLLRTLGSVDDVDVVYRDLIRSKLSERVTYEVIDAGAERADDVSPGAHQRVRVPLLEEHAALHRAHTPDELMEIVLPSDELQESIESGELDDGEVYRSHVGRIGDPEQLALDVDSRG